MKNMKYKMEDKEAEHVYDDLFKHTMYLLNEDQHSVELVASSLIAIGQRLYRTHFNDTEYKRLMDFITTNEIEPYNVKKERIH